jgi:hypothetical protein
LIPSPWKQHELPGAGSFEPIERANFDRLGESRAQSIQRLHVLLCKEFLANGGDMSKFPDDDNGSILWKLATMGFDLEGDRIVRFAMLFPRQKTRCALGYLCCASLTPSR